VAHINGQAYGSLRNYVNVTAQPLAGDSFMGDDAAMIQALAVPDMSIAIPEPVQYEQFCDAETIAGSGVMEASTSVIVALNYGSALAGEGGLEMDCERALSEKAGKLNRSMANKTMPLNFFENTKMSYSGVTPLVG
jgi:hypothetical protein